MEQGKSAAPGLPPLDSFRKLRHDLRNTCNGIRLTIAVLERETDPKEKADCLEGIERAADEAVVLIDEWMAKNPDEGEAA